MRVQQNISLKPYNTFGIEVFAKNFVSVNTIDELRAALQDENFPNKFILSGGSNILLTQDIEALVIHINLKGIEVEKNLEDSVHLRVMSGENWHELVLYCLKHDYGGLENLSLIPGCAGTAPMQNIGAYGVEIKDVLISCDAMNISTQKVKTFTVDECDFGYRESIFKKAQKGNFVITSILLRLSKKGYHKLNIDYGAIKNQLLENRVSSPTIQDISEAVITIRNSKLPNPKIIGNSGSFFKNPVISLKEFEILKQSFEDMPSYPVNKEYVKVPAGWLIEKTGFKGKRYNNFGVHKNQALVLVNYGGADGSDILKLANLIQDSVKMVFGIAIEKEVNIY